MDVRVEAIRQDAKVGRGTCSTLDECFTDAELTAWLDEQGIGPKAVTKAVRAARSFEAIRADVFSDRNAEAEAEMAIHRADMRAAYEQDLAYEAQQSKCSWLVEVNAAAYHNQGYDEMVASLTEEEIEEHGMPEMWYPESPGAVTMEIECGGEVAPDAKHGLCESHEHYMAMDGLEFEQMVEAR